MISPSLGMNSPAVTRMMSPLRRKALLVVENLAVAGSNPRPGGPVSFLAVMSRRAFLRFSVRLAPAFGHGLREVREQHGEPEPHRNPEDEPCRCLALAEERLEEECSGEDGPDQDDEHDGVADLHTGIELAERVDDRLADDGRVEERTGLGFSGHCEVPQIGRSFRRS
jgi:hypothetical protein